MATTRDVLETRRGVVAHFEDLPAAQKAVTALGIAGVSGEEISLSGAAIDEAKKQLATDEADARVLAHILKYIIVGAVIGTIVGAAVSWPIGRAFALVLGRDFTIAFFLASLLLTTLMSHMLGGFIGYSMAMQAGQSWELSFHSSGRRGALVVVRSDRDATIERAEDVLRRQHAVEVYSVDAEGRRI